MIKIPEYVERRERLLEQMTPGSVALVPAAKALRRSHDTDFPFRQDSDFYYLTGFNEPDALLILDKDTEKTTILCREKDQLAEIWEGRRLGFTQAIDVLSVDSAASIANMDKILQSSIDKKDIVYFAQGNFDWFDSAVLSAMNGLRASPKKGFMPPKQIQDLRPLIHEMRLIKSEHELALMRRSAEISSKAHCLAMEFCHPGAYEYQVESVIQHHFMMNGARNPAYSSIVGGGENACILHYTENQDALNDGDLLLIDAGSEYHGYAADITRTFPINGKFTPEQKALYQIVLDAQLAAIAWIKPGCWMSQALEAANKVLIQGLLDVGLLQGDPEVLLKENAQKEYFIHGLGHWIGLDVHDVGVYKIDGKERPFEPGMVLTVEPGLYIAPHLNVPEKWKGIGIRIEDNLLVTENGHEVLTDAVPKSIKDIESLMQS
ncbi:Xaa-Pro aminopeptidase [Algicola sagamiensis]|uniref:Xaa-Pro aminopeptidase n=1 Tax=Algicola sagamiensis TaxID=163869 RepID=UPI00037E39C4|nr:Xaa-Pro aminopeptidase [Algicola sagamiensis]